VPPINDSKSNGTGVDLITIPDFNIFTDLDWQKAAYENKTKLKIMKFFIT
jgi:hypothetical protein